MTNLRRARVLALIVSLFLAAPRGSAMTPAGGAFEVSVASSLLGFAPPRSTGHAPIRRSILPADTLEWLLPAPHDLGLEGGRLFTRVPFRWLDEYAGLQFDVTHGQFGALDPALIGQAATATVEAPKAGSPAWLTLRIDPATLAAGGPVRRHGTWELTISASPPMGGAPGTGEGEFDQTLELTRGKSILVTPAPFTIEQVRLWSLYDRTAPTHPLRLRWSGGPPPADVVVFQEQQAKSGNRDVRGWIERAELPGPLDPLVGRPVRLEIEDDFELGESIGQLTVASPDMDDVTISFTVWARQPPWVLLLPAVLGLGFGFLVRVFLEAYIERTRALLQLDELGRRVTGLRGRFDDPDFHAALEEISKKLKDLIAAVKAAGTTEEIEQRLQGLPGLQADLDEAIVRVEVVRATLETELTAYVDVMDRDWRLPGPLETVRAEAGEMWTEALQRLASGSLIEVRGILADRPREIVGALEEGWRGWRLEIGNRLSELQRIKPRLPKTVAADLGAALQGTVRPALDAALPSPREPRPERIEKILDLAHLALETTETLVESVASSTADVIADVRVALETVDSLLAPEPVETLPAVEGKLRSLPPGPIVRDPPTAFEALLETCRRGLTGAWDAIAAQFPSLPLDVKSALENGEYVAAAEKAVKSLGAPTPAARRAPAGAAAGAGGWTFEVTRPTKPFRAFLSRQVALPPHIVPDRARAWKEIAKARTLQTALVTILLLFVAGLIFGDSFVGTLADWGKVFFWGFTVDVGVNVLLQQAQQLQQP